MQPRSQFFSWSSPTAPSRGIQPKWTQPERRFGSNREVKPPARRFLLKSETKFVLSSVCPPLVQKATFAIAPASAAPTQQPQLAPGWERYPAEFWLEETNQRWWLAKLAEEFKVVKLDDWYKVRDYDVITRGGLGLLEKWEFSFCKTIIGLHPGHVWYPWKFHVVPKGFWVEPKNQRRYLEWLGKELGVKTMEDWYKVHSSSVSERSGVTLLWYHKDFIGAAVKANFPEHEWKLWMFDDLPKPFWDNIGIQREYLDWLANKINIKNPEDWYGVKDTDFIANRGLGLLQRYSRSISACICKVYEDYELQPWRFGGVLPRGFWEDQKNQRAYLDWLAKELKIEKLDDWYTVKSSSILSRSGSGLLNFHNKYLSSALVKAYPDHKWQLWRFPKPPKDFWNSKENHVTCLNWIAEQLGVKSLDDWYTVSLEDFVNNGGAALLQQYGDSLYNLLSGIYPDHDWKKFAFPQMPREYWAEMSNHHKCMEWLAGRLNVQKLDDWYQVTNADFIAKGGSAILAQHGKSLGQVLCTVYPEHAWDVWRLDKVPPKYWEKEENQRRFLEQIASQLNVKTPDDWYKVRVSDIAHRGGGSFLQHFGNSLGAVLATLYPDHKWKLWKLGTVPKGYWENQANVSEYLDWLSEQYGVNTVLNDWSKLPRKLRGSLRLLSRSNNVLANLATEEVEDKVFDEWISNKTKATLRGFLAQLFPGKEVVLDSTQDKEKVDVVVPEIKLAFQYLSKLDPETAAYTKQQHKLEMLRKACSGAGITLIEIPFWWDYTADSLKATINAVRPELTERGAGTPIPVVTPPPAEEES